MKHNIKFWSIIIIYVAMFLIACVVLLSGCKVQRNIAKSKSDSTTVSKTNAASVDTSKAGQVKKQTTKEDSEWWRIMEKYEPKPGVTNVYPSTIIYEGGKGSRQTDVYDSNWVKAALSSIQAKYDSTAARNEQYRKDSESKTKGLGLFFVVLICIGCIIAYAILSKYLGKFRILRS